jgi:hypothetical protein
MLETKRWSPMFQSALDQMIKGNMAPKKLFQMFSMFQSALDQMIKGNSGRSQKGICPYSFNPPSTN